MYVSIPYLSFMSRFSRITGPASRVFHVYREFMHEMISISPYSLFSLRSEESVWNPSLASPEIAITRKSCMHYFGFICACHTDTAVSKAKPSEMHDNGNIIDMVLL